MSLNLSRKYLLAVIGLALLAVIVFVVVRGTPLASIRVTVVRVGQGDIAPALFGIGIVEARRAYLIGPIAAGRVKRVLVDVGDAVMAGQLLAEMDPVDLDQRVAATEAAVARARSAIASAEAQIQDANSRRELAAINARRFVDLGKQSFVSQSVVDEKLQAQKSADAQQAAAEASLAAAVQDLARLEAEREGLRQQRANVRLLAPADGVVTSRDAEPGSTVVAGQAVLKLVEPSSLWISVRLDQGRSAGLRPGLPAEIVLRSQADTPLSGKVVRVELLADSVTEERMAQVAFDAVPAGVSIGEMAEVTLKLPATSSALFVPNASIKRQGDTTGVWVLADGRLRFTPVKLGASSLDGKVQIVEGLKAGDEVVVYSERALQEDSRIEVVEALAGAAR